MINLWLLSYSQTNGEMAGDLSMLCLRGIHRGTSCLEAHGMCHTPKIYFVHKLRVYGNPPLPLMMRARNLMHARMINENILKWPEFWRPPARNGYISHRIPKGWTVVKLTMDRGKTDDGPW